MYVFSFIAISAMCQKMESGSSTIDGKPAAPKPAAAVSSKAYAGYVAPAAVPKQATPAEQAKKKCRKICCFASQWKSWNSSSGAGNSEYQPCRC